MVRSRINEKVRVKHYIYNYKKQPIKTFLIKKMMKKEGVKKVTKEAIKTLVEFLEYKINEIVVEALNISNKTKKPLDIDFRCPRLTGRSIRDAINNINDIECIEVDDINDIDNIDNIEYIEDIENWEIKE